MQTIKKDLMLDQAGVDAVSQEIAAWLADLRLSRQDRLRIQLTMEELLLRVSEHFEGKISGKLSLGKILWAPVIRFHYRAEAFDPIRAADDHDNEMTAWTNRILARMGLSPSWHYRHGWNTLSQKIPRHGHSSQLSLAAALGLAIVVGIAGTALPVQVQTAVSNFIFFPISDFFFRLLNTFLGPMVFFSIVVGICGIGNASDFERIGRQMVTRFLLFTLLSSAAAVLLARPFFRLTGGVSGGVSQLISIRNLILDIIPSNPVRPFYDGNTLQIIFMAAVIGVLLVSAGDSGARVRELAADLNDLVTEAVRVVCRLLPLFIFASFSMQIWESGIKTLAGLWKPIVLCSAVCAILLAVKLFVVCLRLKVNAAVLLKKIFPSMVVGFSTASGSAAYSLCEEINEKKLGIEPMLSRVCNPVGSSIYCGCTAVRFVLVAFTAGEQYGVGGGISWMLTLWLVSTVVSFAVPPVTGGTMACVGILIKQLGLPGEVMAVSGLLSLVLDFIATGFSLGLRHLELILQADHLGMLDRDKLRKS